MGYKLLYVDDDIVYGVYKFRSRFKHKQYKLQTIDDIIDFEFITLFDDLDSVNNAIRAIVTMFKLDSTKCLIVNENFNIDILLAPN